MARRAPSLPPRRPWSPPLNRPPGPPEPDTDAPADPDLPLLRAIADGDAAAFRALVDRHLERLHAMAARLLDDAAEAEDVCQDALLQAWKLAPRWKPGGARFSTWLHGVALNACRDRLRRRRPGDDAALERLGDAGPGPARRLASEQAGRAMRRAIAALPQRQREALVLCHFQELRQAEAAALMGISVDALESLLARARRGLRQALGDGVEGSG